MIMIGNAEGGNQDYVKMRALDIDFFKTLEDTREKTNPNLILFLQYWASLLISYVCGVQTKMQN